MRVLVLTPIYPWVANPQDAVFVRQQVRSLTREGLRCEVVAFRYCPPGVPAGLWRMRYSRRLEPRDKEEGFPVHDVFVSRSLNRNGDVVPRVARALTEYIQRNPTLLKTDVIYAHWLWPAGAAALHLRSRFGWPVVTIARGSEMHHWQTVSRHCRSYVQRVIRESDRVLANCAGLRDEAYRLVPDLQQRIDVAYNRCDTQRFAPATDRNETRRRLGFTPDAKLMLFCGSVIERKGIRDLVKGWESFCETSSDWQLVVVGRLVEPELVRQLARTPRVILVGPVPHDEVPAYMQAADAYVQPSIHEGLANATMEAMATGLPAIATDTGGQSELIADGHNGWLIPVGDHTSLSEAFVNLASDPFRARDVGARARDTIIGRFSQPSQIAALAALLKETASKQPASIQLRRRRRSADAVGLPAVRVAIVGCGQIADAHLQAARRSRLATVVAVCDRSPDLARQAAVRFAVPEWDTDFGRLLARTRPDVVHIATPPATHLRLFEQAVDAGAHVYVEKPFALDAAEATEMLAMAAERGRLVCAGHDRLFDPAWLECRQRIRSGAIGTVTHAEVFQAYDLDGPFGRVLAHDDRHWVRQLSGGLFQNAIPHALATIADLIRDERPVVSATSWSRSPYNFQTDLQVLVRGAQTSATLTFVTDSRPATSYLRVYGNAGWLEVDYDARATRLRAASALPSLVTKLHAPLTSALEETRTLGRNAVRLLRGDLHYFAGMQELLRLFYGAVLQGGRSPIDPADVYRVSVLMDDVIDALNHRHDVARQCEAAAPA